MRCVLVCRPVGGSWHLYMLGFPQLVPNAFRLHCIRIYSTPSFGSKSARNTFRKAYHGLNSVSPMNHGSMCCICIISRLLLVIFLPLFFSSLHPPSSLFVSLSHSVVFSMFYVENIRFAHYWYIGGASKNEENSWKFSHFCRFTGNVD